jgi:signal transduction histidine kinase
MSGLTQGARDDIAAISRIAAIPNLLQVICHITGMGFAAVARVTDDDWTACAVRDEIEFGVAPGTQLDIDTTLCKEARTTRQRVVIDQASVDPVYSEHHTPRIYGIESYISVPIVLPDGEYFGNLCAIDRRPAEVSKPSTLALFSLFAELISVQLDNDRKRAIDHAALMNERKTGELREEFIAVLGHDLRNPLAAISANAFLLENTLDGSQQKAAHRISTNVHRMSALIDDVLDFARGRLGSGMEAALETVDDLASELQAVVNELQDTHPERRISTRLEIARSVQCDLARLQQLVSNLVANAIAHGATDGTVSVEAHLEAADLLLAVHNDGEPIVADSLPKIFGPFWRNKATGTREGLGLGLYICSQIVAAHGGTLQVTSSKAEGTRFLARMPIATPPPRIDAAWP